MKLQQIKDHIEEGYYIVDQWIINTKKSEVWTKNKKLRIYDITQFQRKKVDDLLQLEDSTHTPGLTKHWYKKK